MFVKLERANLYECSIYVDLSCNGFLFYSFNKYLSMYMKITIMFSLC